LQVGKVCVPGDVDTLHGVAPETDRLPATSLSEPAASQSDSI
jgi:hypothetical protein